MVRERRKSFYEAIRRIADLTLIPSQSTIVESPKRKIARRQEPPKPPRRSNRLRGIHVAESSLNIPIRRQTRSNKTQTNSTNVANAAQQPRKIQCRRVTVALERMSTQTMNEMLGIENSTVPPFSPPALAASIVHVSPRRIATRRCTVNLERMDLSSYRVLPPIEESVHEDQPEQQDELVVEQPELEIELSSAPTPAIELPLQDIELRGLDDSDIIMQMEDLPVEDVAIEEDVSVDTLTETEAVAEILVDTMSSFGLFQLGLPRPSTPTPPPRQRTSLDAPLTPGKIVDEMMDTDSEHSQDCIVSLSRMNLSVDTDSEVLASTYFHLPSETSLRPCRALVPFRNRHQQSSQTETMISWTPHGSISQDSIAVECSQSMSDIFCDQTGIVEPKKGFIDSDRISYGAIVKYRTDTFAVNCFDHGDDTIRYHFLSKFCRSYCAALNSQFTGKLCTTKTTARLMVKYSHVDESQIRILEYGVKTTIGNVNVTAIQVPNFPGAALFLFEAKDEKTIVHVANFRLINELESDASLLNSKIDDIRFDESILSGLFYQSPRSTDRYMDLMAATAKFLHISRQSGLSHLIVLGAVEIGMEFLIYRLTKNFDGKAYVSPERRAFLDCMKLDYDRDTLIRKLSLREILVSNPDDALIHVLPVDDITLEKLMNYKEIKNYVRVLGIRPRGCDAVLQTVVDGVVEIVDVANPLIGDLDEYERFVRVHTNDHAIEPIDHGERSKNSVVVEELE
ncbi:uncharacterized protein LOC129566075 [Sitodiplosis mosellana]|uniref:uncharacterized protein LOC129566075 n=1 Tax=Sitodiplosis mosellana TaxID=263140 RepID=UPI002444249C|nr:uncharacterized protein LOC129566075 [Sitodiplosis mosellana]